MGPMLRKELIIIAICAGVGFVLGMIEWMHNNSHGLYIIATPFCLVSIYYLGKYVIKLMLISRNRGGGGSGGNIFSSMLSISNSMGLGMVGTLAIPFAMILAFFWMAKEVAEFLNIYWWVFLTIGYLLMAKDLFFAYRTDLERNSGLAVNESHRRGINNNDVSSHEEKRITIIRRRQN